MSQAAVARLDAELVRRGLARSRGRAQELVADGRVQVGGVVARKPSQPVTSDDPLEVVADGPEYVSRGAHKLEGALAAVEALAPGAIDVLGQRCLDVGASTGGFTQVLLARGAEHVVAVDVGHGQLAPALAADPRVTSHEGTDARALTRALLGPPVRLVVGDLSFIPLGHVLPTLLAVAAPRADLLLLVKPQFEVGRQRLGSGGVVTSPELRLEAVQGVATAAARLGADVEAVIPSTLPGPAGNREYFLWLVAPGSGARASDAPPDGAAPGLGAPASYHPSDGSRQGLALAQAARRAVVDGRPARVHPERRGAPRRVS